MKFRKITAILSALTLLTGSLSGLPVSAAAKGSGDIDENGAIQIADAILLARWIAEDDDITVTAQGLANADMNGDELVNPDDAAALLSALAGTNTAPPAEMRSVDLLADVQPGKAETLDPTAAAFRSAQAKFSADLLRTVQEKEVNKNANLLVSPVSVSLALGMTMNGAKGQTLEEMQKVLGDTLTADELNAYYAGWSQRLLKSNPVEYYKYDENYLCSLVTEDSMPVTLANAIWIKENEDQIHVPERFLQTTKDYYHAAAYKAPFDNSTVDDVNDWCDENTHHMIPKVLDYSDIGRETVMLLANALTFEDVWATQYESASVGDGEFHAVTGETRDVKMMYGEEGTYLNDGRATGFIKPYRDPRYCFAAVLPNEDISLDDYVADLDGEALNKLLGSAQREKVQTAMPKFSFDYSAKLEDTLKELGMPTAFTRGMANFTGLNDAPEMATSIDQVIHKTFIDVSESGTKAAAVTVVTMRAEGVAPIEPEMKYVTLDRPFLFMILDTETNLPIFLGTVKDIQ